MEKVMVDWEELNNLLFFLEKNVEECEGRGAISSTIHNSKLLRQCE